MIYPTKDYILNESYRGINFAGCLMLKSATYNKPSFPKVTMHKFEGNKSYAFSHGVIPHLKVIIVTREDDIIDDETVIYFGSHNFSSGAWGKLEKNNT
jgi:tyrosyl-DNA phosphodiesterase-1